MGHALPVRPVARRSPTPKNIRWHARADRSCKPRCVRRLDGQWSGRSAGAGHLDFTSTFSQSRHWWAQIVRLADLTPLHSVVWYTSEFSPVNPTSPATLGFRLQLVGPYVQLWVSRPAWGCTPGAASRGPARQQPIAMPHVMPMPNARSTAMAKSTAMSSIAQTGWTMPLEPIEAKMSTEAATRGAPEPGATSACSPRLALTAGATWTGPCGPTP